jgi:peptidoglycan/xylan/chitin deacetylase (PgdA/CDA1 family)
MTLPISILLYHRFGRSKDPLSTPSADFERELCWLADRGYRSLTLDEFEHGINHGASANGRKSVLITFDDGYAELATVAAPALRRYGFNGVAFLITSECPPAGDLADAAHLNLNHISWDDARKLASEGIIEFQSHTHSHARWDASPDGTRELERDLAISLDVLSEELRLPRQTFRHLAWPWGRCNESWERVGRSLGFIYQHIVQRGAVTRPGQTIRLPRFCFDGASTQAFRTWMTLLTLPGGATFCNRIFGTIRTYRQGAGYV